MLSRLLVGALLFVLLPVVTLAQSEVAEVEGDVLAEINVGDASSSVNTKDIDVKFTITNQGTSPQSDIKYGVELIKTDASGGQSVVDRQVSDETLSLAAGASINKNVKHPLSGVAPGEYSVWAIARTTGGIMLGLANAGMVTVTDSEAVSFLADTCYLTVDNSDTRYNLVQGVDVSSEENLRLSCDVENYSSTEREVVVEYNSYLRTAFGESVSKQSGDSTLTMASGKNSFGVVIPKVAEPQAYDVVVVLKDAKTGEIVSSHLPVHYVLRGASATIQTVNFDKTVYQAGETMSLKLYWTGPADDFDGSRGAASTIAGEVVVKMSVVGSDGMVCADPVTQKVEPGEVLVNAIAKVNCINPEASISLVDEGGKVLDSRTINIESDEMVTTEITNAAPANNPYTLLVPIAITLALIVLLVVVARHKKSDFVNVTKLLVLGVVAVSGLLGSVPEAEAVSWTHYWSNSKGDWRMGVAANANATTYAPGQTIGLSSSVWNISCTNNSVAIHRLTATLDGQTAVLSDTDENSRGTVYGSGTLTAPATPGNYVIRATILTKARGETSYRDIPITVVAPSVPAIGNFDSVDPVVCSVAGWAYDPDVSASSISVHVYRDRSAFAGGTFVTSCAANQYRADVNTARGISGNHGFNCNLPASYLGTGAHNLYIHAIDNNGSPNNVISSSPRSLACSAPPSATITGSGCSIPVGGSTCTGSVTWNILNAVSPNVYNLTNFSSHSVLPSGTNQPVSLNRGDTVLQARDNSNVLNSVTISGVECASGSTWNGTLCAANPASASIFATGCSIPLGGDSCQGIISSWLISNAASPNVHNQTSNVSISTSLNGSNVPINLPHGATTIVARNGSTVLDTETVNAVCDNVTAPYWNGSECTNVAPPAPPQISLDLSKDIIRSGQSAEIRSEITAGYPTECTLLGASVTPIVITHSGVPETNIYTHITRPLTAAQIIQLTCEPNPPIVGVSSASQEVRVNVIPSIQEI